MKRFIFITLIYFFTSVSAYAYLDPGTGFSLMQMLVAIIAVVGSYITFYWRKTKIFFNRIFSIKKKKK